MDPASVLKNHLSLCEGVYKLLLEENSWLKIQKSVPSKDILDRKHQFASPTRIFFGQFKKIETGIFLSI